MRTRLVLYVVPQEYLGRAVWLSNNVQNPVAMVQWNYLDLTPSNLDGTNPCQGQTGFSFVRALYLGVCFHHDSRWSDVCTQVSLFKSLGPIPDACHYLRQIANSTPNRCHRTLYSFAERTMLPDTHGPNNKLWLLSPCWLGSAESWLWLGTSSLRLPARPNKLRSPLFNDFRAVFWSSNPEGRYIWRAMSM